MRPKLVIPLNDDASLWFSVAEGKVVLEDPDIIDADTGEPAFYRFNTEEWDTITTFVAAQRFRQ